METLYDLLGALPRDEAEELRTAFRRAVKGTHPDIKPGDPDAALKFRQIVRANEILSDPQQRAAYDHLLAMARLEKEQALAHPVAVRVHRLASGVMTLAMASIVAVTSYLLSTALVATAHKDDAAPPVTAEVAAASPVQPPQIPNSQPAGESASTAQAGSQIETTASVAPIVASAATSASVFGTAPMLNLAAPPPDLASSYATFFHARGIFAYRNGDLNGAIADLDQAIQLDPNLSVSYADRGIVYYRLRKFDRAFADIAQAKRIEKQGQPKPPAATAAKPHAEKTASASPPLPLPPRRPVVSQPRRTEWYYSDRHDWFSSTGFN